MRLVLDFTLAHKETTMRLLAVHAIVPFES